MTQRTPKKAMILAAGVGKRMRPVTEHTPKCLIPILGKSLIVYHLEHLKRAGIEDVVINVRHLGQKVIDALGDGSQFGLQITYSIEDESLNLDVAGGIVNALPLLGTEPFLLISADIWCDIDFSQLSISANAMAHMVMVDNPEFLPTGDFALQSDKLSLHGDTKLTYGNIGVYSPALFSSLTPGPRSFSNVIRPVIEAGQVTGEYLQAPWFNVGTPNILQACETFVGNLQNASDKTSI